MKKIVFTFCLSILAAFSYACINQFIHSSTNKESHPRFQLVKFDREFDKQELAKEEAMMKAALKDNSSYTAKSDYAVVLMKLGRTNEALGILRELAKSHANEYIIAANLGTAYELAGKNDSALYWIKEGMRLNSESHEGSEWVHVKILEAKLKMKDDPSWLKNNSVLGLPAVRKSSGDDEVKFAKRLKMIKHITYQLVERIPFTTAPDPLLANILSDLGDLYYLDYSVEYAAVIYKMALVYAGGKDNGLKERTGKAIYLSGKFGRKEDADHFRMERFFQLTAEERKMIREVQPVVTPSEAFVKLDTSRALVALAKIDVAAASAAAQDTTAKPPVKGDDYSKYTRKVPQDNMWKFSAGFSLILLVIILMLIMKRKKK